MYQDTHNEEAIRISTLALEERIKCLMMKNQMTPLEYRNGAHPLLRQHAMRLTSGWKD